MSMQVGHVTIGLGKGIGERVVNQRPLAGVLTDAVFDWADGQPEITGIVWSLWPDTYPGLIVLSPFKLSLASANLLVKHIEVQLKRNHLWDGSLKLRWSSRNGEVRLVISDDEYLNDSTESITSTQNQVGSTPPEAGATKLSTRAG